jgi:phosphonate transport system substrate-binding protein
VVEGLQSGAIDVAKIGPAGYVSLTANDPKAIPFATQEKRQGMFQREGPFYHALLVVLANSRFTNVESLKSARLALTDPGSTSGSLVPRKRFAPTLGMPLERYFSSVSHTGSHAKSITALAQGEVDAVFLASTQLEDAHLSGSLPMQQVRVLWKSEPIPFDPFVFRGQLCESLRKKIRAAFLGPESDAALKPMLDSFLHARRFVPVTDKHYAGIRALMEFER